MSTQSSVTANLSQFLQTENQSQKQNNFSTPTQSFSFDDAHAEYLLIEEEVFNKVRNQTKNLLNFRK